MPLISTVRVIEIIVIKMRVNLYSRLLKYQSSKNRSNLENYLTEMLCDYLNRLSEEDFHLFVKYVLFFDKSEIDYNDWKDQHKELHDIIWRTQYHIELGETYKCPDLICFGDRRPIFLIEAKIGAGFTQRNVKSDDDKEISIDQLKDYGNWLSSVNEHSGLILLTHSTSAPPDFLDSMSDYGVSFRNVISWQRIYNYLSQLLSKDNNLCTTKDFINFLEEQGMATEAPTHLDFSALDIFVEGPGMKIGNAMKTTRENLEKRYPNGIKWRSEEKFLCNYFYTIDYDAKVVWSWAMLDHDEYSYLGWGIVFPRETGPWEWRNYITELPKIPFVFMGIFSNGVSIRQRFEEQQRDRPSNWIWSNDVEADAILGITTSLLSDFLSYDGDFNETFLEWTDKHFNEGLMFFRKLTGAT